MLHISLDPDPYLDPHLKKNLDPNPQRINDDLPITTHWYGTGRQQVCTYRTVPDAQ